MRARIGSIKIGAAAASLLWIAAILLFEARAAAQESGDIRRLRGVIGRDEQWSGRILITDDVEIDGATVTVAPGTIVEFAGGDANRHPTLYAGGRRRGVPAVNQKLDDGHISSAAAVENDFTGRLELRGEADKPIVFRTAANSGAGRVVVTVRNRIITTPVNKTNVLAGVSATQAADDVAWQHVRFERLGYSENKRALGKDVLFVRSAVTFNIRGGGQSVSVTDCVFVESYQLQIQAGEMSSVAVTRCRFEKPAERSDLDIFGVEGEPGPRDVRINDNRAAAAISSNVGPLSASNNILVGPFASLVVKEAAGSPIRVSGNYVHCTAKEDDGRYAVNIENPDAVIRDNIFCGGTNTLQNGSRHVSDNAFIAADRLASSAAPQSRTHRLVASLPTGAVFENNVLLGPAHALIAPQATLAPRAHSAAFEGSAAAIIVRNNVFDGMDDKTRAVHLGLPRRVGGAVEFYNNLVVRCGTLAFDPTGDSGALVLADYNAIDNKRDKLFDRAAVGGRKPGEEGWSAHDVRAADAASLGLAPAAEHTPDLDADIVKGKLTVAEARKRIFDAYRPHEGSPLLHAGKPSSAGTAPDIGLVSGGAGKGSER